MLPENMKSDEEYAWADLPTRSSQHFFRSIGVQGVRIETVEAPIKRWQRLICKWCRLATPKLHYINLDLDMARFPDGLEIGDVYQNSKAQIYIVTNFSKKGIRVKLRLLTPVEDPKVFVMCDWQFMYHVTREKQ